MLTVGWFFHNSVWRVSVLDVSELFPRWSAVVRPSGCCVIDRGLPYFRNFYSSVPVDVVRMKSYMNCLFDPVSVSVRITINKLNLIPKRLVSGVVGVL